MFSPSIPKLVTLLGAIALLVPSPALAEWIPITVATDKTEMYIDSDSVARSGQYASFFRADFYSLPHPDGTTSSVLYQTMDCRTGAWKSHRKIGLNANRQVVFDDRYSPSEGIGKPPQPGSPGAAIRKYVCSR